LKSETHSKIKKSSLEVAKAESKKSVIPQKKIDKFHVNTLNKIDLKVIDKKINYETPVSFDKMNITKFLEATGTIILAGLFDRSFFITTLMAIKYSKTVVFISASASLTVIGIIAVYLGITINRYIPIIWIESVAVCLFLAFGGHMIYDATNMENDSHSENLEKEIGLENNSEKNINENVTNVNIPIDIKEHLTEENNKSKCIIIEKNQNSNETKASSVENHKINENTLLYNNNSYEDCENTKILTQNEMRENIQNPKDIIKIGLITSIYNNETTKVFVKVFILIFFSEIGDRSQISTIYLTATFNKFIVLLGVIFSSILLSIIAVFGGKLISNKISEKNLTMTAGVSFLLFGVGALIMIIFENDEK